MKHNFKPYLNPVFIETGTFDGDGVVAAFKAGFEKIISIELDPVLYERTVKRLPLRNVSLYQGDSLDILPIILKDIDQRITFWLDGHFSGTGTASGKEAVPLFQELQIIAQHPIKTHTIIIDDMRLLRSHTEEWQYLSYGEKEIRDILYSINPDYKLSYAFGVVKNDILIAQV